MKKAILFVRVSTERQDFTEQEKDLYRMAIADGYSDEDIIPIAEKESGIKLSEAERNGLNRMKELVDAGSVDAVYLREVSRLGRTKKVLFSVLDYLITNGVQLIIQDGSIRLLNPDGSVNNGCETAFTIYAQWSEDEMRVKKERFSQGKRKCSREGRWSGGSSVRYGYTIDADKKYAPHPADAENVREIYRLYTTTDMGMAQVTRAMNDKGVKVTKRQVLRTLSFEGYTGKCKIERGNERNYPPLISRETFEAAGRKRKSSDGAKDKSRKFYLGAGLITCPRCGKHYVANTATRTYTCIGHTHKGQHHGECEGGGAISINALDTILWHDAFYEYMDFIMSDSAERKRILTDEIGKCRQTIENLSEIDKLATAKMDRASEAYADGMMSRQSYLSKIGKIRAEADDDRKRLAKANEKIEALMAELSEIDNPIFADEWERAENMARTVTDFSERRKIVRKFITDAKITPTVYRGERATLVDLTHETGTEAHYIFYRDRRSARYGRKADVTIGDVPDDGAYRIIPDIAEITRLEPKKRARKTAQERLSKVG